MTTKKTMSGSPLVDAYIQELEIALTGSDPREKEETIIAVRSHLEQALSMDSSAEEITKVLHELGNPNEIAAAMTPGPQAATNEQTPNDPFAWTALAVSALSLVILVPFSYFAIPLAFASLVGAGFHFRAPRANKPLTRAAIIVAALTLVIALMLALTLVAAGEPTIGTPPHGVPLEQ